MQGKENTKTGNSKYGKYKERKIQEMENKRKGIAFPFLAFPVFSFHFSIFFLLFLVFFLIFSVFFNSFECFHQVI